MAQGTRNADPSTQHCQHAAHACAHTWPCTPCTCTGSRAHLHTRVHTHTSPGQGRAGRVRFLSAPQGLQWPCQGPAGTVVAMPGLCLSQIAMVAVLAPCESHGGPAGCPCGRGGPVGSLWARCGLAVAQGSAMPFLGNGSSRAIAHAPPAHSSRLSQPGREEREQQWGRQGPGTAQQGTAWHWHGCHQHRTVGYSMAVTQLSTALTRLSPAQKSGAQHGTDMGVPGMAWTRTNTAHVCH